MPEKTENRGRAEVDRHAAIPIYGRIHSFANDKPGTTFVFILTILFGIIGILGSYNLLPYQIEIQGRNSPSSGKDDLAKGADVTLPPPAHRKNEESQPEKQITNRAALLIAALVEWQSHGVKADLKSLGLLQSITNEDAKLFPADQNSAWEDIKSAKDVLTASEIGLSAATIDRLPVYIKSSQNGERDEMLVHNLKKMFEDVKFRLSNDEDHAAIVFYVSGYRFDDVDERIYNGVNYYTKKAALAYNIVYWFNKKSLFHEFIEAGQASVKYDDLASLEGCALLDASYSAAEKFIATIDSGRPRPFGQRCQPP